MLSALQKSQEVFQVTNTESQNEITNSLLSFCTKMGSVFEIKDFLFTLKAQIPRKFKTGELLLFYESGILALRRAYIKNGCFYEESTKSPWPDTDTISLNNTKQSFYLANEFGKPFSKTLVVPLSVKQKQDQEKTALLFVEMGDWKRDFESLTDFFKKRSFILNLIFERVLSNTNSNRVSYLWSQLFIYWEEPLAILQNFQPIRTNKAFKKSFLTPDFFSQKKKFSGFCEKDGKSYQLHYYPISQFRKNKETGLLYFQDMTKHLHLKEQLFQNEKMLSLCELGKNMAHQLNNPLTGLRSMTQILYQTAGMKSFKEELSEMEKATERSQKIIKNLLSFSQIQGEENSCNLNQAVKGCLPLLKSLTKGILIKQELCKEALKVKGELAILQQVAYNLILNSCQALQEDQRDKEALIEISTKKTSKNMACLKVRDNGPGIAKQNMEKVFQAFWTNKSKAQGTGLGLGISRQLIRKLGGDIFVSSREKEWTCFTVLLPIQPS